MIKEKRNFLPQEFVDVEEDVIEDLEKSFEELEKLRRRNKRKKLRYPSSRDIYNTVKEAANLISPTLNPADFPGVVRDILKSRGFYTGLVSDRRIWRAYKILVAKKNIPDILGLLT